MTDEVHRACRSLAAWRMGGSAPPAFPDGPLDGSAWARLLDAATRHRILGPLAWAASTGDLPVSDEQLDRALAAHRRAMAQACVLEQRLVDVAAAFDAAGIAHRVLKGPAVAHLDEEDPSLRSFYDIDVLVRGDQVEEAWRLLADWGGRRRHPEPRPGFDRRFGKGVCVTLPDGLSIDLHRTLAPGPFGVRLDLDDLFSASAELVVGGRTVLALDGARRFLHACLHAVLGQAEPRLAQLRDVVVTWPEDVDLEEVWAVAGRHGVSEVVAVALDEVACELGWSPPPALTARIARRTPDRRARRWLQSYRGDARSGVVQSAWAAAAVPGARAKVAYATALVLPSAVGGKRTRTQRLHSVVRPRLAAPRAAEPFDRPRPRAHLVVLPVGDELVVHDPLARRTHRLNPSAALVWRGLATGRSAREVSDALAARTPVRRSAVDRDVDALVTRLESLGLLVTPTQPARTDRVGPAARADATLETAARACAPLTHRARPAATVTLGPFAALDHHFTVESTDGDLAARLAEGLAALPPGTARDPHRYEVHPASGGGGWLVVHDGRVLRRAASAEHVAGFVWWHVQRLAVESTPSLVRLHAAGIARGGAVVALAGRSGAGKSTLVSHLATEGFGYVTDEVLAFDPSSREVAPLPLPIKVGGRAPRYRVAPTGRLGRSHLAACIFHRYEPGAATRVAPLGAADALVALLEHAFGLGGADRPVLEGLRRVALAVPCFEMVRGDVATAGVADQLEAVFDRTPGAVELVTPRLDSRRGPGPNSAVLVPRHEKFGSETR